jgi:hypothetical protein
MGQTAHHYLIFEIASGFCGITWNNVGITRFQLPTRSAEAAERTLLRRVPGAAPGGPTPEVVEAVAAVKRYFEGEETDFSGFRLDLSDQDAFRSLLRRGRSDGATRPPMALWRRNSAPGQRPRAMSVKPWPRIRWR